MSLGWSWLQKNVNIDRADWSFHLAAVEESSFSSRPLGSLEASAGVGLRSEQNPWRPEWDKLYEACLVDGFAGDPEFFDVGLMVMSHSHEPQMPAS